MVWVVCGNGISICLGQRLRRTVVLSVLQETESICVLTRDIIPSTGDNTSSTGSYAHTPVLPKAIQHSYAGQAMSSAHHHLYSQQKKAGNNW